MKYTYILFFALICYSGVAQQKFENVNQLLDYVTQKSITLQKNEIKLSQAKKAKLAAIINVLDPVGNNSMTFINNIKLPVSVFPSEILGGAPGTYTEVQTGVQYTNTINQNAEIKLVNFQGWENLKLSKLNIELTESNNQLSLKSLQESIATSYFNIVMLQEQLKSTKINEAISDSLYRVVINKFNQGLVKKQDVNDAKVSFLNTKENATQIQFLIRNYELSLKILCDIPDDEAISIEDKSSFLENLPLNNIVENNLEIRNSILNEKFALGNFKQYKKQLAPTLSFVASQSWQLYNQEFKVFDGSWINSQYIGLKLSVPMPSAKNISEKFKAKYDYQLAQKNTEQIKIKSKLQHEQLINDFDKVVSQYATNKEIFELTEDTYFKNKNLYNEGLIGLDLTLTSYNAMVNANYSLISARINALLQQTKIEINNKIR